MKFTCKELGQLIADLSRALAANQQEILPSFSNEKKVEDAAQLLWQSLITEDDARRPAASGLGPAALRSTVLRASVLTGSSQRAADVAGAVAALSQEREELAVNFRCELCPERLYPVKRYYRPGRLPLLLLIYNGPYALSQVKNDLSRKYIFGGERQDQIFNRILAHFHLKQEDLHYQELPACHFNAARTLWHDWRRRAQNCLQHAEQTIRSQAIEKILLCGATAIFLLGKEEAAKYVQKARPLSLKIGEKSYPAAVMRSPDAFLALETRRQRLQHSADQKSYQKALEEEKRVKAELIDLLENFLGGYSRQKEAS